MTSKRAKAIEAYLRHYFVEVSVEEEKIMKILHINEYKECEYCKGIAHYDTPVHNEGLAWHDLCEICFSLHGEIEYAIRIVHTGGCNYCATFKYWEEKQSVLPF